MRGVSCSSGLEGAQSPACGEALLLTSLELLEGRVLSCVLLVVYFYLALVVVLYSSCSMSHMNIV